MEILVKRFQAANGDLPATFGEREDGGHCWTEFSDGWKEIWTDRPGNVRVVRSNGRTCTVLETVRV
jgi:hypothetical protein